MDLRHFLRTRTDVGELCVVRADGWIVFVAYIDSEDLFRIPSSLSENIVKEDSWGTIPVKSPSGEQMVACHFIDV